MEGILIAESENSYQVVGCVSSRAEAEEMAKNYLTVSTKHYWMPAQRFTIHLRDSDGGYTTRETV